MIVVLLLTNGELSDLLWKAPTNFVPAVAVEREELVLFGMIGRKGYVGGIFKHIYNLNR
jgi:hypothetical protein